MGKKLLRHRLFWQGAFAALTNGYWQGFARGRIYQGPLKKLCLPGLNCYSCPGALGSCPIGSLQAVLGSAEYRMAYAVVGFLLVVGALIGRLVCGWLCPFGLVQDLLHKIPWGKKRKTLPGEKLLRLLKYGVLVGFVIVLPLVVVDILGQGSPWFCKYICPSGTLLAGWPLVLQNPGFGQAIGWLFAWKNLILVILLVLSVFLWRPFCRYLCPLGAIYGLMNPISLWRMRVDAHSCTRCGACQKACPMDLPVRQRPNSPECVRCGQCRSACQPGALQGGFGPSGCAARDQAST